MVVVVGLASSGSRGDAVSVLKNVFVSVCLASVVVFDCEGKQAPQSRLEGVLRNEKACVVCSSVQDLKNLLW